MQRAAKARQALERQLLSLADVKEGLEGRVAELECAASSSRPSDDTARPDAGAIEPAGDAISLAAIRRRMDELRTRQQSYLISTSTVVAAS